MVCVDGQQAFGDVSFLGTPMPGGFFHPRCTENGSFTLRIWTAFLPRPLLLSLNWKTVGALPSEIQNTVLPFKYMFFKKVQYSSTPSTIGSFISDPLTPLLALVLGLRNLQVQALGEYQLRLEAFVPWTEQVAGFRGTVAGT